MKVAIIDLDNMEREEQKRKITFPNVSLMKISAYHKAKGDTVEFWNPLESYDLAYRSKVFTFTSGLNSRIKAGEVITGGTGYDLENKLPQEIECISPDYELYNFSSAYGFLTRGCPNNCGFCIVTKKEGNKSKQVADLSDFHRGQKEIKLLDPNILACTDREKLLLQLSDSGSWVDFNQGLDIRLIDKDVVALLSKVKTKRYHFAWDNPKEDLVARFKWFKELSGIKDYSRLMVYVLVNYNSTLDEDMYRIMTLKKLGFDPYVMTYRKWSADDIYGDLARWVNNKIIFRSISTFEEYDKRKEWKKDYSVKGQMKLDFSQSDI